MISCFIQEPVLAPMPPRRPSRLMSNNTQFLKYSWKCPRARSPLERQTAVVIKLLPFPTLPVGTARQSGTIECHLVSRPDPRYHWSGGMSCFSCATHPLSCWPISPRSITNCRATKPRQVPGQGRESVHGLRSRSRVVIAVD